MQQTLTNKFAVTLAAIAVAFGAAFTALAYDELEIEVDVFADRIEIEVQYEEDGSVVEEDYTYETTDLDTAYEDLADDLGITVAEVEDAVTSVTEEDDEDEDEMDDEDDSDDMDEDGQDDEDESMDDDEDDSDDSDYCDRTSQAAGWGVAKKCVEEDDWQVNDKMEKKVVRFQDRSMDKYRDYGLTTDRDELQAQLRELMMLLIQLLQQQQLMMQSNA